MNGLFMFNVVMSKRVLSKKSSVYWARMVTPAPAVNFWLRAWRQVIDEMFYTNLPVVGVPDTATRTDFLRGNTRIVRCVHILDSTRPWN